MTVESIAKVVADLRAGRVRQIVEPQLFSVALNAAAAGPVVDATAIYRSLVAKDTPVALYEDHPCIAPPWERACVAYENEHGNVVVAALIVDERDGDTPVWVSDAGHDIDWADVRWVTNAFVFIGGRSDTSGPTQTAGPLFLWQHAVYRSGEPADLHWTQLVDGFPATQWDMAHLTLLGTLNFLSCRNVELVEPSRPRAEARRVARTGVTVSEINVFPAGRSTRSAKGVSVGGVPLSTVRGHFASYGEAYGKGLLFGKLSGRFWHPAHARGAVEHGAVEHDYKLVPR